MRDNFYATLAQVLPLLLLAFIWDSGYLRRLSREDRHVSKGGGTGVWFWTKPRVRVYTLFVAGVVTGSMAVAIFVLGGIIPDSYALRLTLSAALVLIIATLLTRITVDVLRATNSSADSAAETRSPETGD